MKTLQGKIAIITGGGGGIGRATAQCFAEHGAKLVLVDLDKKGLSESKADLTVVADISTSEGVTRVVHEAITKFKKIDILVNCAGILRDATLLKMEEEKFDQVIRVNLKGTFLCTQACAKIMTEQKYGKIVNISSV